MNYRDAIHQQIDAIDAEIATLNKAKAKLVGKLGRFVVRRRYRDYIDGFLCMGAHIPGGTGYYDLPHSHAMIFKSYRDAKFYVDCFRENKARAEAIYTVEEYGPFTTPTGTMEIKP